MQQVKEAKLQVLLLLLLFATFSPPRGMTCLSWLKLDKLTLSRN